MPLTPEQRTQRARLAAHTKWAHTQRVKRSKNDSTTTSIPIGSFLLLTVNVELVMLVKRITHASV